MENIMEILVIMLSRLNRKRDLHQRAFTLYTSWDMKYFTIPLMSIQFINAILPQIGQVYPQHNKKFNILVSSLAAMSAIWLGFEAKEAYAERAECHKNAASIYQHLAVLAMVEKHKLKMMDDYDVKKFFSFQEMAFNLEGKAKDDECLVPINIAKARKLEVALEEEKNRENEDENSTNSTAARTNRASGNSTSFVDGENGKSLSTGLLIFVAIVGILSLVGLVVGIIFYKKKTQNLVQFVDDNKPEYEYDESGDKFTAEITECTEHYGDSVGAIRNISKGDLGSIISKVPGIGNISKVTSRDIGSIISKVPSIGDISKASGVFNSGDLGTIISKVPGVGDISKVLNSGNLGAIISEVPGNGNISKVTSGDVGAIISKVSGVGDLPGIPKFN